MSRTKKARPMNFLLAFDGSEHSLAAIQLLRDLPVSLESKVTAIGVLIPRESSNHAVIESALEQADALLHEKGFTVQTDLMLGNPAEKIIEYAQEHHPDLIVAGAKGLRHTLGILLGGVAQQIVEYAQQPVLVVRAPYRPIQRVLLVTDGSVSSIRALEYLAGAVMDEEEIQCQCFPLPAQAQVRVMHVLPPLPAPDLIARTWPIGPDMLPPVPYDRESEEAWIKEEEIRGKAILGQAVNFITRCSGIEPLAVLQRGDAATEIIQYVKDHGIDLIIAGSRGFSEMRSWLLGSVSRKLVHYASCSVLIVKGNI
ncbi:MAG: universal stress protein [Anaerolineales bacterium]|jgi:nucleotide-binding universal stress UspA family protein|nr:universal stress protein [Anaerolineales bacterium]